MAALQLGLDFYENEVFLGLWSEEERCPRNFAIPGISNDESIPLFVYPKGDESFIVGQAAVDYCQRQKVNGVSCFFGTKAKKKLKINGTEYDTVEMLAGFFNAIFSVIKRQYAGAAFSKICITGERFTPEDKKRISHAFTLLGYAKDNYCIITHADAFLRYMIGAEEARRKLNSVCIDLDSDGAGIYFYSPADTRNQCPAYIEKENTDDILKCGLSSVMDASEKSECFDRLVSLGLKRNRTVNILYVTGKSMDDDNVKSVLRKYASERLKIFSGRNLYAAGACYRAATDEPAEGILCDGQIRHTVSVEGYRDVSIQRIVLLEAGTELEKASNVISVIPDETDRLIFRIKDMRNNALGTVIFPLEDIYDRETKTHRVEVTVRFADLKNLVIKVRDLGFGSIYPATYRVWEQIVSL